jgi:hypothetical protein
LDSTIVNPPISAQGLVTSTPVAASPARSTRANPAPSPRGRVTQREAWRRADLDQDGRLTPMEARRMPRLSRAFDAIDRDADSFITAAEVRAWRASRRKSAPRPGGVDEILRLADGDGDGRLSRAEAEARVPRLARHFQGMDADANGWVSREELFAWFGARRERARLSRPSR